MVLAGGGSAEEEEARVKDDDNNAPIVGENLRPPRETKNATTFADSASTLALVIPSVAPQEQPGDPKKGVERIFEAVTGTGMVGPLARKISRLVLGDDRYARMKKSRERFGNDLSLQEEVTLSTNYS